MWRRLSILSASQSSIGRNKVAAAIKQDGMDIIHAARPSLFHFQAIRLLIACPWFMR